MHNIYVKFQQYTGKGIQIGFLAIKNMKKILEC